MTGHRVEFPLYLYTVGEKWSCSVMSGSLWPHGLRPPGSSVRGIFSGKSAGVGCHFLLRGIFLTWGSNPGVPHCRQTLYPLSHQGSPYSVSLLVICFICSRVYMSILFTLLYFPLGLPRQLSGEESTCRCRRLGFDPWVRKIPWRSKWQPTPVFLPGKPHGQRSLVGYSPRGCKSWTQLYEWT